eukprot:8276-Heterococcus_DN1.PRE.2
MLARCCRHCSRTALQQCVSLLQQLVNGAGCYVYAVAILSIAIHSRHLVIMLVFVSSSAAAASYQGAASQSGGVL